MVYLSDMNESLYGGHMYASHFINDKQFQLTRIIDHVGYDDSRS